MGETHRARSLATRLEDRYARDPWRYLVRAAGLLYFGGLAAGVVGTAVITIGFLDAGASDAALICAGAAVLCTALIALIIPRTAVARDLEAWTKARDPALLGDTDWAVKGPRRLFTTTASVLFLAAPLVAFAVASLTENTSAPAVISLVLAALIYAALISAIGFVPLDLLTAPLLADLEESGGRIATSESIERDLTGALFGVAYLAASLTAALVIDKERFGDWTLAILVPIGLAIAALIAIPIRIAIAGMVGRPIRNLVDGTRAVTRGELGAHVPLMTSNDLGELTIAFNEMVEGLREREALRGELASASARIAAASDQARRGVERDLHDGAQQSLVLLNLKLGMAERDMRSDPETAAATIAEARADLVNALEELRDLAHGIYPRALTSDGLAAALGQLDGIEVSSDGTGRYPPELEAAIYFCCLEAVQNARKYAGDGASIEIEIAETGGRLSFTVADDGAGFDPTSANGSAGLQNMTDRIRALGGTLEVESALGSGTRVSGSVPLPAPAGVA